MNIRGRVTRHESDNVGVPHLRYFGSSDFLRKSLWSTGTNQCLDSGFYVSDGQRDGPDERGTRRKAVPSQSVRTRCAGLLDTINCTWFEVIWVPNLQSSLNRRSGFWSKRTGDRFFAQALRIRERSRRCTRDCRYGSP